MIQRRLSLIFILFITLLVVSVEYSSASSEAPPPVDVRVIEYQSTIDSTKFTLSWGWNRYLTELTTEVQSSTDGLKWSSMGLTGKGATSISISLNSEGSFKFRLRHLNGTQPSIWVRLLPQLAFSSSGYTNNFCTLELTGQVYCDGGLIPGLPLIQKLVSGTYQHCALGKDSKVYCWGMSEYGIQGVDTLTSQPIGTPVVQLSDVVDIASMQSTSCALTKEWQVFCWGQNLNRSLGSNNDSFSFSPKPVLNLDFKSPRRIVTLNAGQIIGIGPEENSSSREVGLSDSMILTIDSSKDNLQSSSYGDTSCVVKVSGLVRCWGYNVSGNLGNGYDPQSGLSPKSEIQPIDSLVIDGVSVIVGKSSNYRYACALTEGSQLKCWGKYPGGNNFGSGIPKQISVQTKIEISFPSEEVKAASVKAAELKAKQEAEAKAAAELKAKQEAEAKAAAELKAKQEAEAKAAAELKAKQEAEAKAAADKAAAELKAKQEAEAKAEAERILANAKAAATNKKTTITCVKGKLTKKVTAVKPKCPSGYKKK